MGADFKDNWCSGKRKEALVPPRVWAPETRTRWPRLPAPVRGGAPDPPAGTGITTFFFCLASPAPLHTTQGEVMMEPRPPHLRHVERITKGPVFMVS